MTDWIEQYSAALDERDAREQAHKAYIDAYTKLADRAASTTGQQSRVVSPSPQPTEAATSTPTKGKAPVTEPEQSPNEAIYRLRADLATTQKARTALQTQLDDLTSLLKTSELRNKTSASQITQLTRQKLDVERKLRDREEEIKGKSKLVVEAQDEMVALGLQLNMAEQKSEKLEKDNKELLDRWMKRKGEEAERMNRDSRWD